MTGGPRTEWSLPDVLLVIVAGLIGSLVASLLVVAAGVDAVSIAAFSIVFAGQAAGSLLAMAALSARRGTGDFATDLGLALHLRDGWGLFLGVGLQVVTAVVLAPILRLAFPEGPPEQTVAAIAEKARGTGEVVLVVLAVVVLAPIVEEMIYRRMLLDRLRRSFGAGWGVVGSAAVFALIHLMDPNAVAVVPGLFVVGLVLGIVAVRRTDLSLAIWTHAGVNLTAVLLLLYGDRLLALLQRLAEEAPQAGIVLRLLTG